MTHAGVGALTALGFVLIIGEPEGFQCGKQVASYLGLVPLEKSSGKRRRLGPITQQGNSMARRLAVEPYWMWRKAWNYEPWISFGSHPGKPGNPYGVQ